MNAAFSDELSGINPEEIVAENQSYHKYLLEKAEKIPLRWTPREAIYESESVTTIHFKDFEADFRPYVIAYTLDRLWIGSTSVNTISAELRHLHEFLSLLPLVNHNKNMKSTYIEYTTGLFQEVKNKIVDTKEKNLSVGTARTKAISTLRFIRFLSNYSNAHTWSLRADISKSLPLELYKYLEAREIETFKAELFELENRQTNPAIGWATLYDIMSFLQSRATCYAKTAITIGVEAGLRISEIRELRRDCLEPVSKSEVRTATRHLQKFADSAPINLDYSESYWLKYHVVKGNGLEIAEGAPILVGKAVSDAIKDILEMTQELHERSGSNMLFLNERSGGSIGVRSYTAFLNDRNELVSQGMPYIRYHQLRSTFSSILHRLGVPIEVIKKYMNHVTSEVTAGYIDSDRSEKRRIYNKVVDNEIAGLSDNKSYQDMRAELLSVIESPEFSGMSDGSRIRFFERLQKRYSIKLKIEDHGTCVLPDDKSCPEGFDDVLPCHNNGCQSFRPDTEEKSFFIALLEGKIDQKSAYKDFTKEHGSTCINTPGLDQGIKSLSEIIAIIEEEA